MAKQGRPGISYEKFVEVWEQLIYEKRESTNAVLEILGGSKSTIIAYRERYERDKASKELAFIKSVKLPEAMHKAIAEIKVEEVDALEKVNIQLKSRIDEYLAVLKEADANAAALHIDRDTLKADFDSAKLGLERKLAAAQARIEDLVQREQRAIERYEQINELYNQARQEAAVAKKEIELLRERAKKHK